MQVAVESLGLLDRAIQKVGAEFVGAATHFRRALLEEVILHPAFQQRFEAAALDRMLAARVEVLAGRSSRDASGRRAALCTERLESRARCDH